MGGISELVAALALLGIWRVWDAREEERKSRQEEEFVPFKLSPLPQRTEAIRQAQTADGSLVAVTRPLSQASTMP